MFYFLRILEFMYICIFLLTSFGNLTNKNIFYCNTVIKGLTLYHNNYYDILIFNF